QQSYFSPHRSDSLAQDTQQARLCSNLLDELQRVSRRAVDQAKGSLDLSSTQGCYVPSRAWIALSWAPRFSAKSQSDERRARRQRNLVAEGRARCSSPLVSQQMARDPAQHSGCVARA